MTEIQWFLSIVWHKYIRWTSFIRKEIFLRFLVFKLNFIWCSFTSCPYVSPHVRNRISIVVHKESFTCSRVLLIWFSCGFCLHIISYDIIFFWTVCLRCQSAFKLQLLREWFQNHWGFSLELGFAWLQGSDFLWCLKHFVYEQQKTKEKSEINIIKYFKKLLNYSVLLLFCSAGW